MSLLGPSGPEVSCEECFEHLDEYVEGRDVPGMAAHLEGCPACREDYESLAALVRADRDGSPTEHD
jgi:predicted anti-sigma-YlaC factor YlaD